METSHLLSKSKALDEEKRNDIITLWCCSYTNSSSEDDFIPTSDKTNSSFDPSPSGASVWKSAANLVNCIEGIGFLTLPYALKEGGIAAIAAFIIIPVIMWYSGFVLTECLYDEDDLGKKRRMRSCYTDLGEALSPKYGADIVTAVFQLDVFLLSASYLVLCGSVMQHALPSLPITQLIWISIAGGLVLPTTFLKSLSEIAWLSIISLFALVVVVVAVVWYGAEHTIKLDLGTILFWDSEGVVMSLSIILYSYAAFAIVPSVEGGMVDKSKFSVALALAYLVSAVIKLLFSVFAFLVYASNTDEVILNNLPPGPIHIAVSCIFVFSCILSYALTLYPLLESFYSSVTTCIQDNKIPNSVINVAVRVTLVFLTVAVAILVPNFLVTVSFIGSTLHCFLGYIFPFLLHLKLKKNQLTIIQVFTDCFLILFGVVVGIFGSFVSFKEMIKLYE